MLSVDDIQRMTQVYGEGWGYAHVCRVLELIRQVATVPHDEEVLTWAVYLHDWGAFPKYVQSGVPHALRSRQIVETEILPQTHFSPEQQTVLLETIEKHDYQDDRPVESYEALLLREADWLDMLGSIGIVRDFAWGPNNLRICYERVLKHRERIRNRFTLPKAQEIAAARIAVMDAFLAQLKEESFEYL